jgi:iron complex outermembrane receptor protein
MKLCNLPMGALVNTSQGGIQRHKGLELSAIGEINENLSLITSAWLKYLISENSAVNLSAFYEGERYADAKNSLKKDGYTRFDAGISYAVQLAGNDLLMRLNVENLLDKDYLAGGENGEINVGKPRTVKFGLSYKF